MKLYKAVTLFLLISTFPAFSQVTIEFPNSNLVFQRNALGSGEILVSGYSEIISDTVQARLIPFATSTGRATDWVNCSAFTVDSLQNFYKVLKASEGWYNLEVRVIKNARVVANTKLNKVGIGEVFLIAGQSNAQGQAAKESRSSNDRYGRVVAIPIYDENMDHPSFRAEFISSNINIYPVGVTSWCWAELGDKIAARFNVPVFFLNAAWAGTDTESWVTSIDSTGTYDQNRGYIPYGFLHRSIQFYRNVLGLRAVLWHQGEADSFRNDLNASGVPVDYFGNMQKVINPSRKQAGNELAWVISQASFIYGIKDSLTIADQRRLAAELPNVFPGPYTDTLQDARADGVHFTNEFNKRGLGKLADAWNQALDDSFFKLSVPMLPSFRVQSFAPNKKEVITPPGYSNRTMKDEKKSFSYVADKAGNYYISPLLPCGLKPRLFNEQPKHGTLSEIIGSQTGNTKQVVLDSKVTNATNLIRSRKSIILSPGFIADSPMTFTAEIGGCY